MKGATAELCARTISAVIKKRLTNIGTSHHLFLPQKNDNNSPSMPKRLAMILAILKRKFLSPKTITRPNLI